MNSAAYQKVYTAHTHPICLREHLYTKRQFPTVLAISFWHINQSAILSIDSQFVLQAHCCTLHLTPCCKSLSVSYCVDLVHIHVLLVVSLGWVMMLRLMLWRNWEFNQTNCYKRVQVLQTQNGPRTLSPWLALKSEATSHKNGSCIHKRPGEGMTYVRINSQAIGIACTLSALYSQL